MQYMNAIATFFLVLFNIAANAGTLSLPMNIAGQTYVFTVLDLKSNENPNAGVVYKMHFDKTHYTYEDSNAKQKIYGHYTYRLLDPQNGIALIVCRELYNHKPSYYSMLLKAKNPLGGLYIYQQNVSKPRMNFGYYALQISS